MKKIIPLLIISILLVQLTACTDEPTNLTPEQITGYEDVITENKALLETVPEFRSRLWIISPLTSLYALCKQYSNDSERSYPCRGGIDYFFVDSKEGNTYPCGYRGNENLGKFWDLDTNALNTRATCYQCDWECFRDPSELFGPLLHGRSNPLELFRKIRHDHEYFRLWLSDLKYSRACDFFDGRKPPDLNRLRNSREPERGCSSA